MCKMNVNLIHLFFVKNMQRKGLFIMSKKLVAFFSASGTTKKVAEMIAEEVKADLFEIEPKVPYTKLDLDWMNKKSRSSVEMSDKKYRPAIMKKEMDMSSYDEILLGCRNNWHIHHAKSGGGQILVCVAGRGYYQEEGKEAVEMKPGDCINIPAEVKHWHGAAPDEWFSHLAIEVPGENGSNEWLELVSDEEYGKLQ